MKKKLLVSVLCTAVVGLSACGGTLSSSQTEPTSSSAEAKTEEQTSQETATEEVATTQTSNMTEIVYLAMLSGGQTIDDYVNKINEKNPDFKANVYDDKHYSTMMPESERQNLVKAMKETGIDENLEKLITNEKYGGLFTRYEYDKDFKNITLYADSSKKGTKFFEASLNVGVLSDTYQALNLVPIDKREYNFKIVDESGSILYPQS